MTRSSLRGWLQRLETLHPIAIDLGLARVSQVADRLGLLPVPQPVVTVAGTNGKGSTIAVLEGMLHAGGYSSGAFTSPHLLRYNERIRIAGAAATDTEIVRAFAAIDAARGDISLTYFEFSALAALHIFRDRKPDVLLLEVGLGGRLDAVNIVDPTVAVITSIGLDHQDWLGATRDAIALEKAGILRPGVPVVLADPEPPATLPARIAEVGARPALLLGREFAVTAAQGGWRGRLRTTAGGFRELPCMPYGPMLPENICAALQAALLLGIDFDDGLLRDVQALAPAARRQQLLQDGRCFILDVAHNPAAAGQLADYLRRHPTPGRTLAVFAAMADKDIPGMLAPLAGLVDAWFPTDLPGVGRAAAAADVAQELLRQGHTQVSTSRSPRQALRRALGLVTGDDRLVIFGSFHTVAAVMPQLQTEPGRRGAA